MLHGRRQLRRDGWPQWRSFVTLLPAPAGNPLSDEFLRLLNAAKEVLSGAIIVRF
jgi:hypothetical protein